ncbi:MAG: 23S rRNA (uracil(1939)-C(5))-methyltransferase RlmD [bacterium]
MNENETSAVVRRPKPGEELKLRVDGLAFGGAGVARTETGLVIFVFGGVPGDELTAYVTKRRKGFIEARAQSIETPSPDRITPECAHFGGPCGGLCGGCKWQNYRYSKQIEWKAQQVRDCLQRIAGISDPPLEPILGMDHPWEYRNKMEYTFSTESDGRLILGLHRSGSFDRIVGLERCLLQTQRSNELRNAARDFCAERSLTSHVIRKHEGLLRNFVIRSSGDDIMACISTHGDEFAKYAPELTADLSPAFPEIKSLLWYISSALHSVAIEGSERLLAGENHLIDTVHDMKLKVSAASFMQTNPTQCALLYEILLDYAGLEGDELVYDLYTGMAPIAMLLSRRARRVIGIESNPNAIADGRENLIVNGIENVELVGGEVEKTFAAQSARNKPDLVVLDPPRIGLHKNALSALITSRPRRIAYVSCNPATLARDAAALIEAGYTLSRARPVDMFPHTAHIECVARFDLI